MSDEATHPMVRCLAEVAEGVHVSAELRSGSMLSGIFRRGPVESIIHIDGWTIDATQIARFMKS